MKTDMLFEAISWCAAGAALWVGLTVAFTMVAVWLLEPEPHEHGQEDAHAGPDRMTLKP